MKGFWLSMRGGDDEAHHKKERYEWKICARTIRRICRAVTRRRSLCFPLANFFEILYNRIDMTVTSDW